MSATNQKAGWIYFVEAEGCDAVKIGWAKNLDTRLRALQCAAPCKLTLLCTFETQNPLAKEREIHKRLSQYHLRGEWFSLAAAEDTLDRLLTEFEKSGLQVIETIPQEHVAAQLARNMSWRLRNIDKARERGRQQYAADREAAKARHRAWYQKNKEREREYQRARSAKKKQAQQ